PIEAGIPGADAIELPVTDGLILAADTTIMSSGEPLYIESDITESGGARKLTIDSNGAVILTGDNSYAGGTLVNRGVLIFGDASSIPSNYLDSTSVGHLTAAADGYIGFGDSDQAGSVQAYFIDDFNKSSTAGTIGFDTDPQQAVPNIFTGSIDLTGFNATARLGSATRAILTGTLTPQGGAYRFGGGGGWLQVDAALTGARSLVLDSPAELPLTLRLTNTGNDFSGGTSVTRSGVIFADGAMPAGSRNVSVSSGGYVGTEGTDINGFLGRITTTATGIIGFDLAPNALSTRVISDTIDLSAFTTGVYLGTASAIYDESGETSGPGLRLTGTLTPGSDGNYRFAAYKGGALEVASALAGSTTQVYIGDPNSLGALGDPQRSEYSTVLLSGDNTFGGTTTFYTGQLMLGHDHALGTGALLVQPNNIVIPGDDKEPTPQLAAFGADRTIANAIQLNSDLAIAGDSQLTLTGVVAGTGELYVGEDGPTTLTLTGNNTFSGGLYLSSDSTVYLQHDHAAGTGTLGFGYSSSSGAIFETAAPVIHGLESDQYAYVELNASNAILEINQNINTTFSGELRADSNYPDNGRFLKTGTGTLRLDRMGSEGGGLYSYGFADVEEGPAISLDVQQGTLVLANGFYVEAGTVRVAGATLALENNVLYRPVIVGAGGRLAGNGDFTAPVSISAGAILAPGLAGQGGIGMLHFDHLELGGSGIYEWQVQALPSEDHLGADVINVYGGGTLVINATAESPFTIKIISLNSGGSGGVLTGLDPSHGRYAWTVFSYDYLSTTLLGNVFDPDAFVLDTSLFSSDAALGGSFTIFQEGNQIMLGFTPVPEPSTYALMALGLGFVVWSLRRRRA
ncbi:MAG: PEP-CTERM sorting domain-containing protein, partial [Opitutaceae bacterium]|nr:PEP-CTERM sorting domain-containing protein [Opitutaceae bacterium]